MAQSGWEVYCLFQQAVSNLEKVSAENKKTGILVQDVSVLLAADPGRAVAMIRKGPWY